MAESRHEQSKWALQEEIAADLRKLAPDPEFKVPDLAGTVEGWRAWGVHKGDRSGVPKLYSVTYSRYYWAPRKRAQAECLRHMTHAGSGSVLCKGMSPPREQCSCGFYSAKSLAHLMSMHYHVYDADMNGMFHIVGRVANWGKVIEGSQGWRSQYAYPLELFVPYEAWRLMEPLSKIYGVPAQLKNTLESTHTEED